MAATEILQGVQYQLKLDLRQTTASGNAKYANVSLGKLSVERFTTNEGYAMSELLMPLMNYTVQDDYLTRKSQVART